MAKSKYAAEASRGSVHMDAIRGGAALAVLLGHTRNLFFTSLTEPAFNPGQSAGRMGLPQQTGRPQEVGTSMGNEAVVVFFVLSGYLVGGSVIKSFQRGTWSWGKYLAKRVTRLWVVLLPALLLGVAVDCAGLHWFSSSASIYAAPGRQTLVPAHIAARLGWPVIAGNAFFLQTILVPTAGTNNSLWSLANEFWYYLAFPLCLMVMWPKRAMWKRCICGLGLAGIVTLAGRSIDELFLIWLLGAAVSLLPLRLPEGAARNSLRLVALVLPFVLVMVRRAAVPVYWADWIVGLCFALVLYLVLHQQAGAGRGMYPRVAGFFSRISYTLYLVHLPLAVFLCACINRPWRPWPKAPGPLLVYFSLNAVLVAVSYGFYLAFEANTDRVRRFLFERGKGHFVSPSMHSSAETAALFAAAADRRRAS